MPRNTSQGRKKTDATLQAEVKEFREVARRINYCLTELLLDPPKVTVIDYGVHGETAVEIKDMDYVLTWRDVSKPKRRTAGRRWRVHRAVVKNNPDRPNDYTETESTETLTVEDLIMTVVMEIARRRLARVVAEEAKEAVEDAERNEKSPSQRQIRPHNKLSHTTQKPKGD